MLNRLAAPEFVLHILQEAVLGQIVSDQFQEVAHTATDVALEDENVELHDKSANQ